MNEIDDLKLLGQVTKLYLSGYYYEAKEKSDYLLESNSIKEVWINIILESWNILLTTWEVDQVFAKLNQAYSILSGDDISSQIKKIYINIIKGWIGNTERMNLRCLREAENALSLASRLLERIKREKEQEIQLLEGKFHDDFWPPILASAWPIYWLRGNIRSLMGKNSEAFDDYRSSTYLLAEAACIAHGIPIDREKIISDNVRGKLKNLILEYATQKCDSYCPAKLVARLYNDVGMFLYSKGDFRTSVESLERSTTIDRLNGDENPYHMSNLGFVLLSINKEADAVSLLVKSYQLMEISKNKWLKNSVVSGINNYYATGRIYYNLGLLVYKWIRDSESIAESRSKVLMNKILTFDEQIRSLFDKDAVTYKSLFKTAAQYYIAIRDVTRALPALVMLADPLKSRNNPDGPMRSARELLWEFSYGMGDFVGELAEHQHKIDFYLAPDVDK